MHLKSFSIICIFCLLYNSQSHTMTEWVIPQNIEQLNTADDDFAPGIYSKKSLLFYTTGKGSRRITKYCGLSQLDKHTVSPQSLPMRQKPVFLRFTNNDRVIFSASFLGERRSQMSVFSTNQDSLFYSNSAITPLITDDAYNSHPAADATGSTLIFSSNRAGGFGGLDLWIITKLADNTWSEPENIGENINTSGNEITPFLVNGDTLYFSSNGMGGKGGYEIMISIRDQGIWQPPIPLTDINSESDDSDFIILPDNRAFFCSDRSGGKGGLDLYMTKRQ
jgi:hypothetical protein